MPNEVFLSYSSIKDINGTVSEFHRFLQNEIQINSNPSVTVFLDKEEIKSGNSWKGSLSAALDQCAVFVILLSPSWLHSEWCRKEYLYFKSLQAATNRKVIIPLRWATTTTADAQNDQEKLEIVKQLDELQQVNWLQLRYERDYKKSESLSRAVGELAETIADIIKGFTLIIKYPFDFDKKAKQDETNPAILATRIQQATILTNFIPTWLIAENEFDPIGALPSDEELVKIKQDLPNFMYDSINDHFSAQFFRTSYNELPELEAKLADFRSDIQHYKKELEKIISQDDQIIKTIWGYLLKEQLFQLRVDALKIKEEAQRIIDSSIAALKK